MLTLYQFPTSFDLPNTSPFCMKLETYLRMANIAYEIKIVQNPARAPKGKLPFIKDDGKVIADSSIIIDYLKQKYGNSLDSHLTPTQLAQNVAWSRLMDEHLYWTIVYSRWIDPVNWIKLKPVFFGKIPPLIRNLVAWKVQRNMQQQIDRHGMGKHTQSEIYQMGVDDLNAMVVQLGNQPFFTGDKPCSIDASVYSYLASIIMVPIDTPMKVFAMSHDNINQYCNRMKVKYYS
jgi:glutathione S-transferase